MEFKDIASVSGKGGLYKVIKPAKSGVILESLSPEKKKVVAGLHNNKVSILEEISIYTTSEEGSVPIKDVMIKIHTDFGNDIDVDTSSSEELRSFTKHIVPDFDEDRVYVSDMKKIISWYKILLKEAPDLLNNSDDKTAKKETAKAEKKEPEKKPSKKSK